jgi:hypothetical protein
MRRSQAILSGSDLIEALKYPEGLDNVPLRHWDSLLRVAKRANLLGRLAEGVQHAGLINKLPAQARTHLKSALILTSHQRQAIEWETRHIEQALGSLEVPVVLLKGAAYALKNLVAAKGRLFGDVDVLVPHEALSRAEAALMLHGWAGHHDSYDDRYYRRWMHEIPPMTHRGRGTVIDVHHNILPLTARACPRADLLLQASQPIPGTIFGALNPRDMVIHSATHLLYESELNNGLRDLFDLDALLTEFSTQDTEFWQDLVGRASLLGLALPLYLALRCARTLLCTAVPDQVFAELEKTTKAKRAWLRMLELLYLRALMPDHPLCSNFLTRLARIAVYLRGHLLRMPPGLLTWHLGRKLFIRLYRNTSRSGK